MNNKFENYLKKSGENISLSHDERARMERTLHAYMAMKPLRVHTHAVRARWEFPRIFSPRPVAALLVGALFVSSAGISYAAADALPGDLLYGIKTQVNEPLEGALAFSPSAKTAWAATVAGERVEEAATLAAQGRLDDATQQALQTNFEAHAQLATQTIQDEARTNPDTSTEAAVRFEAQLSEYGNVLAQVTDAKKIADGTFAQAVQNEHARITAIRVSAEADIASATSTRKDIAASRMRDAAKNALGASFQLARAASEALSTSSSQRVAVQLESAQGTISAGEDLLGNDSAPQALGAFQNALSATEKIGVFLQTSSAIHKRTGLLIAETSRGQRAPDTVRVAPIRAASMIQTLSATSEVSASTSASVQNNSALEDSRSYQGNEQQKDSESDEANPALLPISVPTPPSF